jgi:hypothetical protein
MRRIPLSRRSHITGFRPVDGEAVEHESALERDFVLRANFLDAGATITSQPITIEFQDGARLRRYTPDFRVIWSDGGSELVEVKYRVDLRAQWARLRPGFIAARAIARENGGRFRIATERGIRGPLLDNARRLLPLRDQRSGEGAGADTKRSQPGSSARAMPCSGTASTLMVIVPARKSIGAMRLDFASEKNG